MGRAPCCDKANVKRGPWSPEEDDILKNFIERNGTGGNWIALPHKAGLNRCGKSCRLRWLNYLRPNIKHGGFTEEEDNIICTLYNSLGSRWSVIASHLQGRTDNDVKNYWNTKLKKKLLAAGKISLPSNYSDDLATSNSKNNLDYKAEASAKKVEAFYYGIKSPYGVPTNRDSSSTAMTDVVDMSCQQSFDPETMFLNPSDDHPFPLPGLTGTPESTNNNKCSVSSAQEASSFSNSSSLALQNTNVSWSGNGSVAEDELPLDWCFDQFPYVPNGFGF